jgi:hypothetical protein
MRYPTFLGLLLTSAGLASCGQEPTGPERAGAPHNTPADVPSQDCRSFAVVSPGRSGPPTSSKGTKYDLVDATKNKSGQG